MSDVFNPHQIPAEYTEVACLLGFIRRYAERNDLNRITQLCDAAHIGDPIALSILFTALDRAKIDLRTEDRQP